MAKSVNQHFVPQFYFRQFSAGAKCIQAYFPKQSRTCRDAPIKGQCAIANFYGDNEAESVLSNLESQYSSALRSMIVAAWSDDPVSQIDPSTLNSVYEFILVQRVRTRLQVNNSTSRSAALAMAMFKHHLASSSDAEDRQALSLLNSQPHEVELNGPAMALQNIAIAIQSAETLSDLDFCIIRNQTEFPFIFCDSPVIFHNTYYQNVKLRGVLGTTTPGLQIFLPLNSDLVLMLYDPETYECAYHNSGCVDTLSKYDVSQINALQFHGHDRAVYFANHGHSEYVSQLCKSHGPLRRKDAKPIHEHDDWLIDGKPMKGLLHQFEPLHNIRLDLSFVKCSPIDEKDYRPSQRNPKLAKTVDERIDREFSAAEAKYGQQIDE